MAYVQDEDLSALLRALLVMLLVLLVLVLSSPPLEALPSNCWHVRRRLLWYRPSPGKRDSSNTQSQISKCVHASFYLFLLFLTLFAGDGLSEELPTLPFSHMLLMLRVPPVGISAMGDLGDLPTSLFPCGIRGQSFKGKNISTLTEDCELHCWVSPGWQKRTVPFCCLSWRQLEYVTLWVCCCMDDTTQRILV